MQNLAMASQMKEKKNMQLGGDVVDFGHVTPQLVILNQGYVSTEHFSNKGITKQVHVVVKNLVFHMELGSNVDLSKCSLEQRLLYDFDREDDEKLEVSYVKNEPMDAKVNIGDHGLKATVEIRIKVLTSQHEDMLFRIRITATDSITGAQFSAYSHPIKVISKVTQVGKRSMKEPSTPTTPTMRKRSNSNATTDVIASTLYELNRQLQEQGKFISMIAQKLWMETPQQHLPPANAHHSGQGNDSQSLQTLSNIIANHGLSEFNPEMEGKPQTLELEDSFRHFLAAYNSLSPEERLNKLDGCLGNTSPEELGDLLDVLDSAPSKKKFKR